MLIFHLQMILVHFFIFGVSGLALFFNLPRHDFGAVQKVLFPKYFSLNSCLSFVTLISFTNLHHLTDMKNTEIVQVIYFSQFYRTERIVIVNNWLWVGNIKDLSPETKKVVFRTFLSVASSASKSMNPFRPYSYQTCTLKATPIEQEIILKIGIGTYSGHNPIPPKKVLFTKNYSKRFW